MGFHLSVHRRESKGKFDTNSDADFKYLSSLIRGTQAPESRVFEEIVLSFVNRKSVSRHFRSVITFTSHTHLIDDMKTRAKNSAIAGLK